MPASRCIKVAAAQLSGLPLAAADTALDEIDQAIQDAAAAQADLLVLPECAYPGYWLGSAADYHAAARLDTAAFVDHLAEQARTHHIHLVCGCVEEVGTRLHNAAVVIDADGTVCGVHRKVFLWGDDQDWFTPGQTVTAIDTPLGRIGVIICADGRAPEIAAALTLQGAELIAMPTCWVNVAAAPGTFANAQAEYMIAARAEECRVPFVAANKVGRETDQLSYCGWSVIIDGAGHSLAQAPPDQTGLISADITLVPPPRPRRSDSAVRRIVTTEPPVIPEVVPNRSKITLAVVPLRILSADCDQAATRCFTAWAEQGVQVALAALKPNQDIEDLTLGARALGITLIGSAITDRLMIEPFGACGCVTSAHLLDFATVRAMALDGAEIIFVRGRRVSLPLLRTRAAENRIFLAAAGRDWACLVDPDGQLIATCDDPDAQPIVQTINLAESADKQVFARTNIWAQRRPSAYAGTFKTSVQPADLTDD